MALRRTYKTGMSLFNRVGGGGVGPIPANNSSTRLLNSAIYCGTSSFNSSNFGGRYRNFAGVTLMSNSNNIDRRMLSTKQKLKSSP